MSDDDNLAFISSGSTGPQITRPVVRRQNYGILGPQDEDHEITLESDMDLFSDQPTGSSPFGPAGTTAGSSSSSAQPRTINSNNPYANNNTATSSSSSSSAASSSLPSSSQPETNIPLDDTPRASPQDEIDPDAEKRRFWEIEYYQKFFNVTTMDVLTRMAKSIIPYGDDFFTTIGNRVDFYGAFWVPTTLIFFMAATGNFATYISCQSKARYVASFLKVVWGAFAIYGYVLVLPLILWGLFAYFQTPLGFAQNLCMYGYSLTVYLPIAVLCIVPISVFRTVFLALGGVLVCATLFRNYWSVGNLNKALTIGIAVVLCIFNFGLVLFFRFYLFTYDDDSCKAPNSGNTTRFSLLS